MYILYSLKNNLDNLPQVNNRDLGLMDKISSWAKDLEAPKNIRCQKYRMLMVVYIGEDLDKIKDWINTIEDGNKVMLALYNNI